MILGLEKRTYVRYNTIAMIIMHVDVNSAFLSWSAAAALEQGASVDLRTIPSVVGGDESKRHGIVLAKSVPAKKFGIVTGESLMEARRKCPGLVIVPPDSELYSANSDAMYDILTEYTPIIERYSVDECFLDYTASEKIFGDPVKVAYEIKDRMKTELGFTVNVGVSCNRLLAKMGSELEKPDKVHTLWPEEIESKLWPLPVGDLFMVGKSSAAKLRSIGIYTIGDLAKADPGLLSAVFKSHGKLMHNYANGIDTEPVTARDSVERKGLGNSITIDHDVLTAAEAREYLLQLCEKVGSRLRKHGYRASLVSVWIKTSSFAGYRHQEQLDIYTDSTTMLYQAACRLFDASWKGEPIRQLGVSTGSLLYEQDDEQLSLFNAEQTETDHKADAVVDSIRALYGSNAIKRGTFIKGGYSGENSGKTH